MCDCRVRLRGEVLRAFWEAHFSQWREGGLNQREYCEAQGLQLKQFENWRAEFKYEQMVADRRVLWQRGTALSHRISHATSHAASHVTRKPRIMPPKPPRPPVVAATVAQEKDFAVRRRNFSQAAKEAIILETMKPGNTVSSVSRRYHIPPRMLFRWKAEMALGASEARTDFATVSVVAADNASRVEVNS